MKSIVALAVLILAVVITAEGRPQEVQLSKGGQVPQDVVDAPKENLKEAEAAYLAYTYGTYPAVTYSGYPYVIPHGATVLLR